MRLSSHSRPAFPGRGRLLVVTLAALAGLSACAGFEPDYRKPGAQRLTGPELSTLLGGHTLSIVNARGKSYLNRFSKDGSIVISGAKGNEYGHWTVSDDRYCLTLEIDPRQQCMEIYKLPDGRYQMVNADGSLRNTFTVD
ncbi:hypothetical protein M5E06_34865 [Azospirillum sp. A1-3]|uniref:hypothetical protein n=1 Tax=Azospirillum sp. A1-3 TaxID=185874 RepID=UPI0020770374|nr:hypothetical protein [Azospirillum sp. A1-3]MCM8739259.1 hypothetical protein [Azospirillum sp. A1-3]